MIKNKDNLKFIKLMIPIVIQQLISQSSIFIDNAMIGQLGAAQVAAIPKANQLVFLFNLTMFGFIGGMSIFLNQFFGARDRENFAKMINIGFILTIPVTLLIMLFGQLYASQFMSLQTRDAQVNQIGTEFIQIISIGFIFHTITYLFGATLRSQGKVTTVAIIQTVAVITNTILNYGLIYGKLGMPQLGSNGAALATVIARLVEAILIFTAFKLTSKIIRKIQINKFKPGKKDFKRYFKVAFPIIMTEIMWSIGMFLVFAMQGRQSNLNSLAVNISSNVFIFAVIIFMGYSDATGIMNGHKIGEGRSFKHIYQFTKNKLIIAIGLDILVVIFVLTIGNDLIFKIYQNTIESSLTASEIEVIKLTLQNATIMLLFKLVNWFMYIGALRSGGDSKFAFWLDITGLWVISIPLTYYFAPKVPIYLLVMISSIDDILKLPPALWRFKSMRWINNLTTKNKE